MPSHLDWGEEDNKAGRNSTKGNNRFLHAFAAVSSGQSEHLIMLDRGSDRKAAKELIRQLGIQEHVTLLAELNRDELAWYYRMADVVVDQFDIGAFGASALEAMACGKPCMIYINESYARECYGDLPPIANAHTAEEIEKQIHALRSEAKRSELGAAAREWILAHHEADRYGRVLVELIQQVTQRTDR
jgi:glycosyltransferase involved in cell wall biosynthesis